MVSTKDLRDIFSELTNEAGKRASDVLHNTDVPDLSKIGRRSEPPIVLWFGVGLMLGAAIGLIAAFLASPYSGAQARAKISERLEHMRKQREESLREGNGATYAVPTTTGFERS